MKSRYLFVFVVIVLFSASCSDDSPETVADDIVYEDAFDQARIRQCNGDELLKALQKRTGNFARMNGRCPLALAYLLSAHRSEYACSVANSLRERPNKIARALSDVYVSGSPQCKIKDIQFSIGFVARYRGGYPDWDEVNTFLICVQVLQRVPHRITVDALKDVLPRLEMRNEIDAVEDALRSVGEPPP